MKPTVIFLLTRPIKEESNALPHLFISLAWFSPVSQLLKDCVTLLNLLKLYGFRYPFNVFSVCCESDFKNSRNYEYSLPASFSC